MNKDRCHHGAFYIEDGVMANERQELIFVLDFIMKKARPDEINMIRAAIDARKARGPQTIDDLDFKSMAQDISNELTERFSLKTDQGEITDMTRRLVTNLIKERVPGISDKELNILLDQWVNQGAGGPAGNESGKEDLLPEDAVISMIDQFIRYSLQKMPENELAALKNDMADWVDRYWSIFNMDTKMLIRDLINAQIDTQEFWLEIKKKLDRRK